MQSLRKDMIAFAQEISGLPLLEKEEEEGMIHERGRKYKLFYPLSGKEEEERNEMINQRVPVDWRYELFDPYRSSTINDWSLQVYESVISLLKSLNEDNLYLVEERFRRIKRDYHESKHTPKRIAWGGGGESDYEKAYNKKYYSK